MLTLSKEMSDQEHLMDLLRKEVRSLLMAVKEGLTPVQLEQEYRTMIGKPLPLRTLGYRSTMELVKDMPDVVNICSGRDGCLVLKVIADETTRGMASLVAKQRTSSKVRNVTRRTNAFFPPSLPRRGRTPPILPAMVKSELKDLLSLSPVLLSDFDKAFARRFGRTFQYMRYGFFSMTEVLSAASDIITIEQTRAGSLLTLKESPSVKQQQEKLSQGEMVIQPKKAEQAKPDSLPPPAVRTPPPGSVLCTESLETPKWGSEPVEAAVGNCGERLKQLEKDIKMMFAQKGAGGTVSSELKEKIRVVAAQYPEGLLASKLPGEFEAHFKEKLSVKELGFLNVMEFVGALNDILHVERKEGEQDWLVFDLESKCLADGAAELKVSSWDFHSENSEALDVKKSQVFNVVKKTVKPYWDVEELQLALEIAEPEIPPDAVQDRSLYCLPALDSSTLVGVFVEYIISPNQFYIRICSRETSEMLEDMMIEMRRCYSNKNVSDRYVMPEALVQPGYLCCVRISEDKWWYRVIIHRVLSEQEVEVFFPDFGNLRTVQKSCLRFLKCCYSKLPAQAIPCSLAWVKPIEGHWTTNAILQFWKLCNLKPLVGVVDEYVNGILHLFLCDTTADEDTYIHQVLRAEGHAVVCRENVPSKGFIEQNPSELYLQPSPNDESSGSDLPLQEQESFCEISRAVNPELNESEPYVQRSQVDQKDAVCLAPEGRVQEHDCSVNSSLTSWDSQGKNYKNSQESPNGEPRKPKLEIQESPHLEIPYLEPVSVISDIWDENWLPLQTLQKQTGIGHDTLQLDTVISSSQTSSHEGRNQSKEQLQQVGHFAAAEETSDHVNMTRTAVEKSKYPIQETLDPGEVLEPTGGLKTPASLGDLSDPAVLSKSLEEFYVSLSCSQPSAEPSQLETDQNKISPNKVQLLTAPAASASLTTAPVSLEKQNGEVIPETVKNEDLLRTQVITLSSRNSCSNRGAEDQNSLILAAELQVSQKLYIPRSSPTAALGAAARLATSSGLFHWFAVLRKLET
ncbi:tudor domain-containing protein 5 isoform X1 [Mauremys reevesii]|uniref:tudor domain-containing protein 5 isoform X1 n=2 Tax=Mauremys reevesii TaxID=260615 RepID=UPI00193FF7AE|nr:tudor domain-containing protein 5 isoform X1 [Mauremys reevesii]